MFDPKALLHEPQILPYITSLLLSVPGVDVPRLMSDNLALNIEYRMANLVNAYVVTQGITKSSNISAPNRFVPACVLPCSHEQHRH
jgi:hypothetical protein